jgi:hypothetical protein
MSHIASFLASLAAMYSTSNVLYEMDPCFFLDQEITTDPKLKKYPKVLFHSTGLPA